MPAESHSTSDPGAILWIRVNVCPQVPLGYDETWKRWGLWGGGACGEVGAVGRWGLWGGRSLGHRVEAPSLIFFTR